MSCLWNHLKLICGSNMEKQELWFKLMNILQVKIQRQISKNMKETDLLRQAANLFDMMNISTKCYWNISKHTIIMVCRISIQKNSLRGDNYEKKVRAVLPTTYQFNPTYPCKMEPIRFILSLLWRKSSWAYKSRE